MEITMTVLEQAVSAKVTPKPLRAYYGELHKTGPDTLGGKYLRQFWHPVARTIDIAPGKVRHIKLLSEDFTLYRGEDGAPHLTVHRCPHRGTQLSVGCVEGNAIRCHYHGWKFDADGTCTERPAEPNGGGGITIRTYPAHDFLGLVFVYIGDGEVPAFPPFPGFTDEGIVEPMEAQFPNSWFQTWENDWDLFHAWWTHRTGEIHGPGGAGRDGMYHQMLNSEQFSETDYGVVRYMDTPGGTNASVFLMPHTIRLLIPVFNELSRLTGPGLRQTYLIHTPTDDFTHRTYVTQLVPVTGDNVAPYLAGYEKSLERRRATITPIEASRDIMTTTASIADYKDHPMLVEIEDLIAQSGQGPIADRSAEKLGRSDAGVIFLRRLMARELQAIEEGRPTTAWAYMDQLPEGAEVISFDPTAVSSQNG
jgi:5,5'-dehydrodivanillate O-demethylase